MGGRRRERDHFAKRAKKESYPARSVYKLQEIDQKAKIVRRNDTVIDLGAAPGSWTLYTADRVGPNGLVLAIDRQPLSVGVPKQVLFVEDDVMTLDIEAIEDLLTGEKRVDVVLSDMAPRTTCHRFVDQSRSFNLFSRALEIAKRLVRPGGRFAAKIFQGEDFETARDNVRALFTTVKIVKPRSVRQESYEIYLIGLNRKST
jgi:23S rRNA (uridine2552-2'-O)-methyltransferase